MITGELIRLEIRPTRKTRISLERIRPGKLLASIHPGFSFFYKVEMNGEMRTCTPDANKARKVFRESCRWAVTV